MILPAELPTRPPEGHPAEVGANVVYLVSYFYYYKCSKWASSRSLVPTPSPVAQLVSLPVTHYVTNWGMEYD